MQPLWKTVCWFLKKVKVELPYDPAIPLLGIYSDKTITQKNSCTSMFAKSRTRLGDRTELISMFIATLFTIAKTWK